MTTLSNNLQFLLLPSGRTLAFAEFGKPSGRPVIYLHGFPTCRLEALAFDAPARRANIRLIAADRPGIGQSSYVPKRAILDHANDVKVLSQHLNLQKFAVLGVSGGAPYALACARSLPKEMLGGIGVLSGMGTYKKKDLALVPKANRIAGWMARNVPRILGVMSNVFVAGLQRVVRWGWIQRKLDQMVQRTKDSGEKWEKDTLGIPSQDKEDEKWTPANTREQLLNILFEPFAQGSKGVVQEAALVSQHWGFNLGEVHYPVKIWHGAKDVNAPVEWVRAMAEKVPGATLFEHEEDTHGSMNRHIDTVFAELFRDETAGDNETEGIRRRITRSS